MWELENIKQSEFDCKCGCGFNNADIKLGMKLQLIRYETGMPVRITSGCRCEAHNKKEGGKPDSAHLRGLAADIEIFNSSHRRKVVGISCALFRRIGIGKKIVHVDIDPSLPQDVMWTYY